jgi:hypothetical protein
MRTADMVKSKYFRARDVEGQPPKVLTIADVTEELMGRGGHKEPKCFLWFMESPKGLQLNKTRVNILEAAYGPDSDLWTGKRIKIYFDPNVEFGGRLVGGVGIKTSPGVVWQGADPNSGSWGEAPADGSAQRQRPEPIWDDKRQDWITPAPPPAAARRPPPPVWNEATQQWETIAAPPAPKRPPPPVFNETSGQWESVDTATGEMAPAAPARHVPPPTIKERIDAGHPPQTGYGGSSSPPATADDWGPLPPAAAGEPDFDDDIPFRGADHGRW